MGIGTNIDKTGLFSADERAELVERVTKPLGNVEVRQFSGLAVQFVRDCQARVIIRGVRSLSDMDTEFTMTLANRKLDPSIETVFLMADEEFSHVSSSLIKQITTLASDEELARFVPREIIADIQEAFHQRNALQCGFCTPGVLVTAHSILSQDGMPSRKDIRDALSGNYCRCTGYEAIVDAIETVARRRAAAAVEASAERVRA